MCSGPDLLALFTGRPITHPDMLPSRLLNIRLRALIHPFHLSRMSLPKPHITPDSFFHKTSPPACLTVSSPSCPTTIYFISGNPGLISYYHPFLSLLSKNLASVSFPGQDSFHIFAHSLAGFELEPAPSANTNIGTEKAKTKQPSGTSGDYYYNVEDQIRFVQARLEAHMAALRIEYGASAGASGTDPPSQRPRVILMGHSVGTYIAMEVLRRHRENQTTTTAAAAAGDSSFDIVGGIMLFPTVIDIASSPAGQKLTVCTCRYLRDFLFHGTTSSDAIESSMFINTIS